MIRNRWWMLAALLALTPVVPASRGSWPDCPEAKTVSPCHRTSCTLIQKSYPVADLVDKLSQGPAGADGPKLLVRALTRAVKPATWSDRGGRGTIEYFPAQNALVVRQTADVHEGVASVLKALAAIQPKEQATGSVTPAVFSASPAAHFKQYGHFVLDNVRVNAMGVNCIIKRVRFMYKGDGIDADVAKCALTHGESEKRADVPKVLTDLLEKVGKSDRAEPARPPARGTSNGQYGAFCPASPCLAPPPGLVGTPCPAPRPGMPYYSGTLPTVPQGVPTGMRNFNAKPPMIPAAGNPTPNVEKAMAKPAK